MSTRSTTHFTGFSSNTPTVSEFDEIKMVARGALTAWFDTLDAHRPGSKPIDRQRALIAAELDEIPQLRDIL